MCNFPMQLDQSSANNNSDKSAGNSTPEPLKKHSSFLDVIGTKLGVDTLDSIVVPMYLCFVFAMWFTLIATGPFELDKAWNVAGTQLEILGLIMVREKIKNLNSVGGISGNTFALVALVRLSRFAWEVELALQWEEMRLCNLIMEVCCLLLALDILRSIFITYRETHDVELDVLKAWYLIPACFTLALLVRPQHWLNSSFVVDWGLSTAMYMDALILMPQVVMMAMSGGKVEAPVANFVAATGIVKCGDIFHTLFILQMASDTSNWNCLYLWLTGSLDDAANSVVFSWMMSVLVHIVQLTLLADFYYYLVMAKLKAVKATEEIVLFATNV